MKKIGFLIFAVAALIFCCRNPAQNDREPAFQTGTITVSLSTSESGVVRTIVPDFEAQVSSIDVSLVSNDGYVTLTGSDTALPWQVTFSDVRAGNWNINVVARDSGNLQIGSGNTANQILSPGASITVPVIVSFSSTAPWGSVNFTTSFPTVSGIDYLTGTIVETGDVSTSGATDTSGTSRAARQSFRTGIRHLFACDDFQARRSDRDSGGCVQGEGDS